MSLLLLSSFLKFAFVEEGVANGSLILQSMAWKTNSSERKIADTKGQISRPKNQLCLLKKDYMCTHIVLTPCAFRPLITTLFASNPPVFISSFGWNCCMSDNNRVKDCWRPLSETQYGEYMNIKRKQTGKSIEYSEANVKCHISQYLSGSSFSKHG